MKEKFSKTELENEQWRDVEGYDGMYQVSDLGRARSKKYGRWKVIRPRKDRGGYLQVALCNDGKVKYPLVHRLVAQAFIENTDETKTLINHIDECKQNNRVNNLEYCTAQYNSTYNDLHHRRTINYNHPNYKRHKLKDLYNPNLTYEQNIEIFKANGIECCKRTLQRLRKDLGLIKKTIK